jgi:hypothetical protein
MNITLDQLKLSTVMPTSFGQKDQKNAKVE